MLNLPLLWTHATYVRFWIFVNIKSFILIYVLDLRSLFQRKCLMKLWILHRYPFLNRYTCRVLICVMSIYMYLYALVCVLVYGKSECPFFYNWCLVFICRACIAHHLMILRACFFCRAPVQFVIGLDDIVLPDLSRLGNQSS
jgi:hypothetical protein